MPPSTIEALAIFLLFIPGFLAERVITILTPKKAASALESLINAVGLSLLIYGLYQIPALLEAVPELPVSITGSGVSQTIVVSGVSIGLLIVIALVTGALLGRSIASGSIYRSLSKPILGRFGLTNRTGRSTVWEDALLQNRSPFVDIHLKNGLIISGSYAMISERPGENSILVIPPPADCVPPDQPEPHILITDEDGAYPLTTCQGMLLTESAEIQRIDFHARAPIQWQ